MPPDGFVNTELAERRNLILANPIEGNTYPTVLTLVCAYQMVKAGETAKSPPPHSQCPALVLDTGENTFTIVDGKKIPMISRRCPANAELELACSRQRKQRARLLDGLS